MWFRGCFGSLRFWSASVSPRALFDPRCPLRTSRSFSVSAPALSQTHEESHVPLRRWALAVSPFGTVRARLGCSFSVRPLDPHAFPEADRAFVTVHGTDPKQEVGLDHLQVHYDERTKELLISAEEAPSGVSIDLAAPVKSNLFITTQGKANVQVKEMECDICRVQTDTGSCLLHSVKGHQVEVQSSGGHVIGLGTIHGNVDISTCGDSAVDVKKLQGSKMKVSTERGPLKVKTIYAESSCFSSFSGKVELGHVLGEALRRDGSNSFIKVSSHSGDIDVYVGDGGSAELHTQEGLVYVRVSSSLRAGVELCGTSVEVSSEVVLHGSPGDQWVKAKTHRGSVRLKTQSWMESMKLGS
uniref:Family with sequence similarity 185 member A n=1 Tax=Mastacembelus armatus TaxID=205130 RepID=A0A3Q3RUV7_9TELE